MGHLRGLGAAVLVTFFLLQGLAFGGFVDCNGNGIDDDVEIVHGAADCNGNGILDECDIDDQTSPDCDADGIPDECDTEIAFAERSNQVTDGSAVVVASDLDGDGDRDAVAAFDLIIVWYENLGSGNLGPQQPVGTADPLGVHLLLGADIDGDGDNDLLHGTYSPFSVAWHENLDGQGTFGPLKMIEDLGGIAGTSTQTVLAVDLDGDEDLDVVWSVQGIAGPNRVGWNENIDGSGTFAAHQEIWGYHTPHRGAAADLDGDQDADLVFGFSSGVAWFENLDGGANFGPPNFFTNVGSLSTFVADIDGDSDADVLANQDPDGFGWFENLDGAGTFGPYQALVDHPVKYIETVDLDHDGDLDIVQASDQEPWSIAWHENTDGAGTFGPPQNITDVRSWSVAVLDTDADTDSDLLVGIVWTDASTQGGVALYENTSDDCNTNGVPDSCDIGSGTSQDCNADGVPDECGDDCNGNGIADSCDLASETSDDCNADGVPDECEPDCNGNDVADECDVTARTSDDCNTDGVPDECEPDCNGNDIADDCDVTGGTEQDCDGNDVLDSCEIVAGTVEDCNDNGVPDTCDGDCNGNGLADSCDIDSGLLDDCNANDVPDLCETEVLFSSRLIDADVEASAVLSADVDGDGDLDVVSGAFGPGIGWYENLDGTGNFGSRQTIDSSFVVWIETLAVADADGDGDADVFAVWQNEMVWYENLDGQGLFGPKQIISTTPGPPAALVAADIDGDMDNDLVRSPRQGNEILWFENLDGNGSFAAAQIVDGGLWWVPSLFVADIDGDMDNDLLAGLTGSGEGIVWYENLDGDGSFGPANVVSTAIEPHSVLATDVDGDGDNDVVGALWHDNRVVWHENLDGSGDFGPEKIISTAASRAVSVFTADIDGDGDDDVLSAAEGDSTIAWYENLDGQGSFGPQQVIRDDAYLVRKVVAADLDGDGDIDALSTTGMSDDIVWYENQSDDCNGNSSPDECETDCNVNGIADSCDTFSGTSLDCNANVVPDECESSCTIDCDVDIDDCTDELDCDPADGTVWSNPGPIDSLALELDGSVITLSWQLPAHPGAASVTYDTLRSFVVSDFHSPAVCLDSDGADTVTDDPDATASLDDFYYLIRVENSCPGGTGSLGSGSDGAPRTGVNCP